MEMNRNRKIAISTVVVLVLFSAYVVYDRKFKNVSTGNNNEISTTTSTTSGTKITTSETGAGYTIEQVPVNGSGGVPKPIPDLNRPVTSNTSVRVSTEAIVRATQEILPLQTTLKKNPADFNSWLNLGMYQKMAGDYIGASISWQYASKLAPTDFISLSDLGNLYAYYLNDKVKGEAYYKAAIVNGPTQGNIYIQLAEVYRDLFGDKNKALAIINQGLVKIPNDQVLLQFKQSLK
jgi:hypothetical protein